jgi:heme-degrading monooxygenase HmoA
MHVYRDAIRTPIEERVVSYAAILYPGPEMRYRDGIEALSARPLDPRTLQDRVRRGRHSRRVVDLLGGRAARLRGSSSRRVELRPRARRLPASIGGVTGRIARVWKGYGTATGVERYCRDHFAKTVLPKLKTVDGFLDATILVRPLGEHTELVVATVWESLDSVKTFAGDRYEHAVVEPVVRDLLEHFEDEVVHFHVALTAAGG